MDNDEFKPNNRNVTGKDLLIVLAVIVVLLPLFWFVTLGKVWAQIVAGFIPVIGLIYWAKIPAKDRAKIEEYQKAELDKSFLGKGFKYFTWIVYLVLGVYILLSLLEYLFGV